MNQEKYQKIQRKVQKWVNPNPLKETLFDISHQLGEHFAVPEFTQVKNTVRELLLNLELTPTEIQTISWICAFSIQTDSLHQMYARRGRVHRSYFQEKLEQGIATTSNNLAQAMQLDVSQITPWVRTAAEFGKHLATELQQPEPIEESWLQTNAQKVIDKRPIR